MSNAFAVLGGMQRLAAALTEAGRRGGFPPAEAETLVNTARGLWRSRSIIESALASEARRRGALAILPPASATKAPVSEPSSATADSQPPVAEGDALGSLQAAKELGMSRSGLIKRLERDRCPKVDGEFRIAPAYLAALAAERRLR